MTTTFKPAIVIAALKASLSDELDVDRIENSPKALSAAFEVMIDSLDLEINSPEIL